MVNVSLKIAVGKNWVLTLVKQQRTAPLVDHYMYLDIILN